MISKNIQNLGTENVFVFFWLEPENWREKETM